MRIEHPGSLEQRNRLRTVFARWRLQPHGTAAQNVIARVGALDWPRSLGLDQFEIERYCNPARNLVLQGKQIPGVAGEALRPEMYIRFGIDQLCRHADLTLRPLDLSLQHIAYAKLAADLLCFDRPVPVRESGVARDDEHVRDAREIGREISGDTVGKILLFRIVAQVQKRQHDNRWTERLRGRRGDRAAVGRTGGHRLRRAPGAQQRARSPSDLAQGTQSGFVLLSDFSAAAGSCERRDQASPGGLIKGVEAHQLARIGQRLFRRCAQTFDQRAQYLCLQLARVFAHSEQPCVKIAVLRQFEIGEERAAKERCGARKIAGRGRLFLGADLRGKEIDVEPLAAQLHALAIRQQAGERGIVDQRADLAEAPA